MSTETQKAKSSQTPETLTMPVKDIVIPEKWNRHKATNMKGLISSIKNEGQLVPLLVRMREDGKTELVDGRRRTMALKELKIADAKIAYAEGDAKRDYLKSLVANLQRQQHNPVEKAEAYRDMKDMGLSHKEIAKSCGVVESSISQHIAIFDLPGAMQRALRDEKITIGHSRQLLRVGAEEDGNFQEKLFGKMMNDHLPVTVAEEMCANYIEKKELRAKKKAEADKAKAKAAKGKGKDTGKGKGKDDTPDPDPAPNKGGRTPQMTDYMDDDMVKEMTMINKTSCSEWLAGYEERRVKTKSPKKREYLRGVVEGLEIACGLRGEED
jgi:ParB family chromosome partitioning protein